MVDFHRSRGLLERIYGVLPNAAAIHFETVESLVDAYGEERAEAAAREAYAAWRGSKSKNGKPYNPANFGGWLEWAVTYLNTGIAPWAQAVEVETTADKLRKAGYGR